MIQAISLLLLLGGKFLFTIIRIIFRSMTELFFGIMPETKNMLFSLVSVLSLIWFLLTTGFVFPHLISDLYTRFAGDIVPWEKAKIFTEIAFLFIPAVFGIVSGLFRENRGKKDSILRGYKYCFIFGIGLIVMGFAVPIIRSKMYLKKEQYIYIPINREENSCRDLYKILINGIGCNAVSVEKVYSVPTKILKRAAAELFDFHVRRKTKLVKDGCSIFWDPYNLMIVGKKKEAFQLRLQIEKLLWQEDIYRCWSDKAIVLEKNIFELKQVIFSKDVGEVERRLEVCTEELKNLDEWWFETALLDREIEYLKKLKKPLDKKEEI